MSFYWCLRLSSQDERCQTLCICISSCGWKGKNGQPANRAGLSQHQRSCCEFANSQGVARQAAQALLKTNGVGNAWKKRRFEEVDGSVSVSITDVLDRVVKQMVF